MGLEWWRQQHVVRIVQAPEPVQVWRGGRRQLQLSDVRPARSALVMMDVCILLLRSGSVIGKQFSLSIHLSPSCIHACIRYKSLCLLRSFRSPMHTSAPDDLLSTNTSGSVCLLLLQV